jgi:N-acetylglutamate synthase-like GNAT family acetyltransferase
MTKCEQACIRPFCPADLASVLELIHNTIDQSYAAFYPPRARQFFKEFHSEQTILSRHRDGEILVLEKDGKIVGTGALLRTEILGVFIHCDFQHCGYGRLIMQALEQKARMKGMCEIELSVSLPSRNFYENLGYEITEDASVDVGEGQHLAYWQARKALA